LDAGGDLGGEAGRESPHLDDAAFVELASGEAPTMASEAHLAICAECREELARFRESVSDFSLASLAWSEHRSEHRSEALAAPRLSGSAQRKPAPRPVPVLGWALAALLAVGVAIPAAMHFHPGRTPQAAAMDDDVAGLNSPEQIAKDNQLMANVNFELSRSEASLMQQAMARRGRSGTRSAKQSRLAKGKR
jgi:hypothetical protein